MNWKSRLLIAGPFALLALPGAAFAQSAAVAPFVANGVGANVAANVTALVSSEMDFMTQYDGAEELSAAPGMNQWCLDNAGCMVTIGRQASADFLLAGMVSPTGGDKYDIYMSLINVNTGVFVRKQRFPVSTSPEVLADSMGSFLIELVTGASHEATAAATAGASSDEFDPFADEDDFEFAAPVVSHTVGTPGNSLNTLEDFEDPEIARQEAAARQRSAEAAARREAEADAQRRAQEAARAAAEQEARRRAEEAARVAAAEESRRRAEEEERRRVEAAALAAAEETRRRDAAAAQRRNDEEQRRRNEAAAATAAAAAASRSSGDDITFGAVNPDDIEVEDIQFGSAVDLISVDDADDRSRTASYSDDDYSTASYSGRSARSSSDDDEPDRRSRSARSTADYYDDLDDLDEPEVSSRDERESRSSRSSSYDGPATEVATSKSGSRSPVTITARGGYSRYQTLGFVSYGAEAAIPLTSSMYLRMGAEAFSVKREIPVQYQVAGGPLYTWETILPIGFGLYYQRTATNVRPYVGGDLTITPYTADFKVAPGFRVRGGADFMIVDNFGFNLNLGAGFWYGADLARVADNMSAAGLVPQISAGTVLAF